MVIVVSLDSVVGKLARARIDRVNRASRFRLDRQRPRHDPMSPAAQSWITILFTRFSGRGHGHHAYRLIGTRGEDFFSLVRHHPKSQGIIAPVVHSNLQASQYILCQFIGNKCCWRLHFSWVWYFKVIWTSLIRFLHDMWFCRPGVCRGLLLQSILRKD